MDITDSSNITENSKIDDGTKLIPFVERFRPQSLEDIISHEEIIETVSNFISQKKMPHLLFYGPPGTGKTSWVLAIAKKMHGKDYKNMILELNASDDRGINTVREEIKSFWSTINIMRKGLKLVVLDEWDAITSAAQFALRRVIEKYTENARFWLICNNVSKIIPAVQSRWTKFRFSPLKWEQIKLRLNQICIQENISISEDAQDAIVKLSNGDMRKVLNILESWALAHEKIECKDVYNWTGRPSISEVNEIFISLCKDNFEDSFNKIVDIKTQFGLTLDDIVNDLHARVVKSKFTAKMKMVVIRRLAVIQERIAVGWSELIQISSLVGVFVEMRS